MPDRDFNNIFFPLLQKTDDVDVHRAWDALEEESRDLDQAERDLARRRRRLEAQRQVLRGVAQLRDIDLDVRRGASDENRRQNPRHAVVAIMRDAPDEPWDAARLLSALHERGVDTSIGNVRAILQRLVPAPLQRVAHGRYQYAANTADDGQMADDGGEGT